MRQKQFVDLHVKLLQTFQQQRDQWSDRVGKRPQIGARKGLAYVCVLITMAVSNQPGKNSIVMNDLKTWQKAGSWDQGCAFYFGRPKENTETSRELRLELGRKLKLIKAGEFKAFWVVDFPLLEWDEESNRFMQCTTLYVAVTKGYRKVEIRW